MPSEFARYLCFSVSKKSMSFALNISWYSSTCSGVGSEIFGISNGEPTEMIKRTWLNLYCTLLHFFFYFQNKNYLPTTVTGFLFGMIPKVYWKNPRPIGKTGANPVTFWNNSWTLFNIEPWRVIIWSYRSVSPNEITGTKGVLQ